MMLHTKYKSPVPCGFGEEDLFMFSHNKPMTDNHAPGAWPISTQGHGWQDLQRGPLDDAAHKI